jgi:hypothetical protein
MVVLSIEWPGNKKANPQAGFVENLGGEAAGIANADFTMPTEMARFKAGAAWCGSFVVRRSSNACRSV